MDCAKTREYLNPYIDGALSAKTRREVEQHLLACGDCAAELEALRGLSHALQSLPPRELPPGFTQALHEKLAMEDAPPRPSLWQRGWVRGLAAAACLVLLIGALATGGNAILGKKSYNDGLFNVYDSSNNSAKTIGVLAPTAPAPAPVPEAVYDQYTSVIGEVQYKMTTDAGYSGEFTAYDMDMPEANEMFVTEEAQQLMPEVYETAASLATSANARSAPATGGEEKQLERKIIRDANLSLKVDNFSAAYQRLNDMAGHYGGYVVSSDAYSYDGEIMQRGYITLRVEANRLTEALAEIESMGKVENQSVNTQDITMAYYDIAGRLGQYRIQEQRLMDILRKAETVEDLIKLESELTRVRAELESLTGQLRYYDQMTALSSININLYQPDADTQTVRLTGWAGFRQEIREGFISGINSLLRGLSTFTVGFIRLLPTLLLLVIAVLAVVLIVRKKRK